MPAHTTLTIDDRESTPVAHAFSPYGTGPNGEALWAETSSVKIGENQLSMSNRRLPNGNYAVKAVLTMPVLVTETINGVDRSVVERVARATLNFTYHKSSTLQERKNLVGIAYGLLSGSLTAADDVLTGLEAIW